MQVDPSKSAHPGHFGEPRGVIGKLMLALLGTVTVWRKGRPPERDVNRRES